MARIGVIGAGYTGLAAAYELHLRGHQVDIFESAPEIGGLAGAFELQSGVTLEKFYHHWFTSDQAIFALIEELGLGDRLSFKSSRNGLYYANSIFRLSSPLDLLRFNPLPFIDRLRTGLMALYARQIKDWKALESISAEDWIKRIGGNKAYETIWRPLLQGKFGVETPNVSAVWFWNKLKLRGGSRSKDGGESLAYYNGGFGALTDDIGQALTKLGVRIHLNTPVESLLVEQGVCKGIKVAGQDRHFDSVLATLPLPQFLNLSQEFPESYVKTHSQVRFLGNTCLILTLKQSLSETYWLNVADPAFPFVGVIEHTNFDDRSNYGGKHIAYLSKYLPTSDPLFQLDAHAFFDYCLPFIQKIFPKFDRSWVEQVNIWKAHYSQPVVTLHYSELIPPIAGPFEKLWLSTMAQVYPEDRGTNYAVQHGRMVARELAESLKNGLSTQ